MSKDYNYEIGYESLQAEWKIQCKRTPRGVTLVKGGNNIYLQFKTPNTTRSKYKCACKFSIDGMHEAVRKSHLVKAQLTSLTSEVEFWNWYEKEIEEKSLLIDDQVTFEEAIKKVEDDFWSRPDRRKQKRDKNNPSHLDSYNVTYGDFYKRLPNDLLVNLSSIEATIATWTKGSKRYGEAVSAMRKLARMNKRPDILLKLEEYDTTQTIFLDLQTVNLEEFLAWRNDTLGFTKDLHKNTRIEVRKAWMWVFSTQLVYALRISEAFAIKNLFEPYTTKDGVTIPALNDPENNTNLIYIGDKTLLGTTVKTGSRIARPNIPPKYPDLIERLDIKNPIIPNNRPTTDKASTVRRFFTKEARTKLLKWKAPFTQTHADRHLGNINGIQAGIPLEVRSLSLGHTPAQNDNGYKNRIATQTTIDLLLNSNSNAIDFVTALGEAKKMVAEKEEDREVIARLLSVIYQKDKDEIIKLL